MNHDPADAPEPVAELRHTRDERAARGCFFRPRFACGFRAESRARIDPPASPFPTALAWIGQECRVRVLCTRQPAIRGICVEAALSPSRALTGTAESSLSARTSDTGVSLAPSSPPLCLAARRERRSFWGVPRAFTRPRRSVGRRGKGGRRSDPVNVFGAVSRFMREDGRFYS